MADEVEGKLVVTSADREAVYEAVSKLDEVAGLSVRSRAVEALTDAYHDTPAKDLGTARVALRVRSQDGAEQLTVKGEPFIDRGVISRMEVEVDWSAEGLDAVLQALGDAKLRLDGVDKARSAATATLAMTALGLITTSPRRNRRVALTLTRGSDDVAELDVDRVDFALGVCRVRHYEIECEAKAAGNADLMRDVLVALRKQHPGLAPLRYSKLELGDLLERLEAEGRLDAMLSGELLTPDGYEQIARLLDPA